MMEAATDPTSSSSSCTCKDKREMLNTSLESTVRQDTVQHMLPSQPQRRSRSSSLNKHILSSCMLVYMILLTRVESFQYISTSFSIDTNSNGLDFIANSNTLTSTWSSTSLAATNVNRGERRGNQMGYSQATANDPRLDELQRLNREIRQIITNGKNQEFNTQQIQQLVDQMIQIVQIKAGPGRSDVKNSEEDKILQASFRFITQRAFASSSWPHIKLGLAMMERQAHNGGIPQSICIQALRSLNSLSRSNRNKRVTKDDVRHVQANAAFRVLQRMCTGVGIRNPSPNKGRKAQRFGASRSSKSYALLDLDERDFSMVLNGFVNIGEMDMAHRVVALQSRTPHAPPLSPVIYSILIKGYGMTRDLNAVNMVADQAKKNGVDPDIVMYNSLMDAYINCDDVPTAYAIFEEFKHPKTKKDAPVATPNLRTYNTMLKGFIKVENLEKALMLSKDMERFDMWDAVTTNTLVGVAVASKQFDVAESILDKYTVQQTSGSGPNNRNGNQRHQHHKRHQRWHPNVEAYTELIDGYAKNGRLGKALEMFKTMRSRGVNPNEYTYTCIIGGLAKAQKLDQAKRLLSAMVDLDSIRPSVVTYNALFTGMLLWNKVHADSLKEERNENTDEKDELYKRFNESNDEALKLFGVMINAGVKPNAITVSTLVDGLGKNVPSRLDEAKALVVKMDCDGFVPKSNLRVSTTLIQACARSSDLEGALATYRDLKRPDVIAFNSLLSGFCDCGRVKMAIDILNNSKKKKDCITPDVATYTILISSLLGVGTLDASKASFKLYKEMKNEWKILPDPCLIDSILTPMVSGGNALGLHDNDVKFTTEVLRDARQLQWPDGYLRRRERTVKAVFRGRMSEAWKEEEMDPLFAKKNWNTIDSGFRLWGDRSERQKPTPTADEFLESKNWNDIDSSFRIL